jgi:hypothetical protein
MAWCVWRCVLTVQGSSFPLCVQFTPPVLTDAERATILSHLGGFYTAAEALLLTEHKVRWFLLAFSALCLE